MLQGFQHSDQASRYPGAGPRMDTARGTLGSAKLQLFALLLLIGMVGLSGWIFYESRIARWDSVERTGNNLVTALDGDISRNLTLYDLSLLSVRRRTLLPELATLSPETRQRLLFDGADQALKFGAIEVLDRNGWVVAASRSSMMLPANAAGTSYFEYQRTAAGDDLRMEMRRQDGPDSLWQLVLTRRIVNAAGAFDGIVRGSIDVTLFQELFDTMDIGNGGVVSLFMRDGTVVARTGAASVLGTRIDFSKLMPPGPSGSFLSTSPIDGVTRFLTFHRLGDFPLDVSVGVPENVVDGPWRTEAWIVALVLAMLVTGSVVLMFIVRREFQRRGAAEGKAADAAAKYRLVADHGTDIISKTMLDGTRTYVSPAYSRILGFDPAEIVGTKAVDFAFPDDVPRVAGALEICIAGTGRASCVYRARHRDGHWLWVEATHQAVRNETGEIVEIVSAIRDITQQQQAAEELASKTGMLDAILANMPDGVCLFDPRQHMVAWNAQLWEILDLDRGAILAATNPTEAFLRCMVERGDYGRVDVEAVIRQHLASIPASEHNQQRRPTVLWQMGRIAGDADAGRRFAVDLSRRRSGGPTRTRPARSLRTGRAPSLRPRCHRRAGGGGTDRGGNGTDRCRRGEPRQIRFPGQHEPRDPHADERDPGLLGPAARQPARWRAAAPRAAAPRRRQGAAHHHQRHPRRFQDRGRQAAAGKHPDQPGQRRRRRPVDGSPPGRRQTTGAEDRRRPRRPGLDPGRPDEAAPDPTQPAGQRGEVHRARLRHLVASPRGHSAGGAADGRGCRRCAGQAGARR